MASIFNDVLVKAQAMLVALNLPQVGANVTVRELPTAEESIDVLPLLCVVPSTLDEQIKRADFEGTKRKVYTFEIATISRRSVPADLASLASWRDAVTSLFYDPAIWQSSPNPIPAVRNALVKPAAPLDRTKLNQRYSYSNLLVEIHTRE